MYKEILEYIIENASDAPEILRIKDKYNQRINLANRSRDNIVQSIKNQEQLELDRVKRRLKLNQMANRVPTSTYINNNTNNSNNSNINNTNMNNTSMGTDINGQ